MFPPLAKPFVPKMTLPPALAQSEVASKMLSSSPNLSPTASFVEPQPVEEIMEESQESEDSLLHQKQEKESTPKKYELDFMRIKNILEQDLGEESQEEEQAYLESEVPSTLFNNFKQSQESKQASERSDQMSRDSSFDRKALAFVPVDAHDESHEDAAETAEDFQNSLFTFNFLDEGENNAVEEESVEAIEETEALEQPQASPEEIRTPTEEPMAEMEATPDQPRMIDLPTKSS